MAGDGLRNFKIDQPNTFASVVFLESNPKYQFGTDKQDTFKDGTPKWEVQCLGAFWDSFSGKTNNEVFKLGVASHTDPGEGLNPFTPVQLVDFEVGVMERTKKDQNGQEKVIGVQVWFRASEVRSTAATGPSTGGRKQQAAAEPAAEKAA